MPPWCVRAVARAESFSGGAEMTARPTRFRLPGIPANVRVKQLGYLFPRPVLEEAINECAPLARAGMMTAHTHHPRVVNYEGQPIANCAPGDRAVMVTNCFIDQWGQTWWDYRTMTTPAGLALESNVLAGAPLGTSYLFGSVEFVALDDKLSVRIVSKLRLLTNDISACPYTPMTIIRPILLDDRGLPLQGAFPFASGAHPRGEPRSLSSRIEELKAEIASLHGRRRRASTRLSLEFELERLSLYRREMSSARDALRRALSMSGDFTKYEVQMAAAADLAQKAAAAAASARECAERLCLSLDSVSGEPGAIPYSVEGDDNEEFFDDAQKWSESAAD